MNVNLVSSRLIILAALTVLTGCDTYDDGRLEMKQYEGENYKMCTPEDIFLVKKNIEKEKNRKE